LTVISSAASSRHTAKSQSRSPDKTRGRCPPIQHAAAHPVARNRGDHFTTLATLTPNSAAVTRHVRPPTTDATTRAPLDRTLSEKKLAALAAGAALVRGRR
jgi:hypothetical protein